MTQAGSRSELRLNSVKEFPLTLTGISLDYTAPVLHCQLLIHKASGYSQTLTKDAEMAFSIQK
jgi:hypothetical protein